MNTFTTCILILFSVTTVKCAKILGVFPSPGYSQFILCEKLMGELANRGHEVTVISAYSPKQEVKNYETILIEDLTKDTQDNLFELEDDNIFISMTTFFNNMCNLLTEIILSHQEVQQLINSNKTVDLVIVEQFGNEAHMGFAQHFNAPLIMFSSVGLGEWNSHLVGNIRLPSIEPMLFSPYSNHMTFYQRLSNSFIHLIEKIYRNWISFPQQQEFLDKYFPNEMCLKNIMANVSLLLLNSHASTTHPTQLTTSAVEIGGFHISEKDLPEDLQKFLDEAENGAVLFSMGSNLKSSNLRKETLDQILKVISRIKQRVLWTFDGTNIPNRPKNLLISKWLPQSDILGHPNTVAFISHGGLLSTTEAVFNGVPVVGIPIFGDQKMNVARLVEKGVGIHLPFAKLSEDTLHGALIEVLENPKYQINAKKNSNFLRDRLVPPLDVAIYWIEYVIRHKGASHLRNSATELYWFQLYLIHVITLVIIFAVIIIYLLRLLLQKIYAIFTNKKKAVLTKNVKQKMN